LDLGIAAEADGRGKYDDDPDALWREKRRLYVKDRADR
jgi:hypothetical protein